MHKNAYTPHPSQDKGAESQGVMRSEQTQRASFAEVLTPFPLMESVLDLVYWELLFDSCANVASVFRRVFSDSGE